MAYTTIDDPTIYFVTVIYTGNDTARTITTGLETTDWIWNKRTDSAGSHLLYDKVRGINIDLNSNSTEADETQTGTVTAFGTNSFSLGTHGGTNASGETKVNWCWSAGGTTGSSNSNGSITSTVSANTTAGFSIVTYTGTGSAATVGHGLGVAPSFIIVKQRDSANDWNVFHHRNTSAPETDFLVLNETDATSDASNRWNDTMPNATNVFLGDSNRVNNNSNSYVMYAFAEKQGYSKFGSYTGNGNADGTFVYTGFKPAFLIIKQTDFGNSWRMYDNKRSTFNVVAKELYPNTNDAEATTDKMDFVSNGFKYRTSSTNANGSGSPYIFMAFAESPFVTSTGIPTTAR